MVADDPADPGLAGQPGGAGTARAAVDHRQRQAGPDGVVDLPELDPRPGEPLANRVVVDLDPGAGMTIVESARAALIVAARMAEDGLIPVPRPPAARASRCTRPSHPAASRDAWAYVKRLNGTLAKAYPDFFIATMSVEQRAGRIYVDYNQNLAARNTIAPYSMRGRDLPVGGHAGDLGRAGRRTRARRPAVRPGAGAGPGRPSTATWQPTCSSAIRPRCRRSPRPDERNLSGYASGRARAASFD